MSMASRTDSKNNDNTIDDNRRLYNKLCIKSQQLNELILLINECNDRSLMTSNEKQRYMMCVKIALDGIDSVKKMHSRPRT